jgi:hypothetical protein
MDMAPPQAPPAVTQGQQQQAVSAFNRLVSMQSWLAGEQTHLPVVPESTTNATFSAYVAELDAYWRAPPHATPGTTRRGALTGHLASAALDMALLARDDGRFNESDLALARAVAIAGHEPAPARVRVKELTFGDHVYAGVLLVQDVGPDDRTLVFSVQRGWERFSSLADAHAGIEQRARRSLVASPDLPGIARQHLAQMGPEPFVGSRDVSGEPFETLVGRMLDTQRDKLEQTWFEFALRQGETSRSAFFADAVFDALHLDRVIDIAGALAIRNAALIEAFNAQRLASVPANVAADWREAEDVYLSTLRAVAPYGADTDTAEAPMPDLPSYAANALRERLRAMGITHDPVDIQVRIDRRGDPVARMESLQALFEGPEAAHIGLVDLAYQNISAFDPVHLSAFVADGTSIPGLDHIALRDLVRRLDLSTRYQALIESTFRTGPDAVRRRDDAARVQRAHMRLQAAEARLSYFLHDGEPLSFIDDRSERGYQWVKAILDAPIATGRARVDGHAIVVRQMTYLGTPLRDIVSIGVSQPASVPNVVIYTPDAPDGISFREFADRAEAGRKFFYHPAFREYILDRLPADYARVLPNGSAREFAGDHLANWVLGSSRVAAYTRTQAPFEERDIEGDFLHAAYDVDVALGLRNTRTFTRSAEQANWAWLVDWPRKVMPSRIIEDAMQGVVTAPVRAAQAAWRFYDSVKAGDEGTAVVDFADFYVSSLSAVGPIYSAGTFSTARGLVAARFRSGTRLIEARPAAPPAVVFETRFAAPAVRKAGQANREGVYAIEGKTYIEHGSRLYAVRYDIDYATWRLTRPGPATASWGPAIQRGVNGRWAYHRVGLRGGSGRATPPSGRLTPENRTDLFDEYNAEVGLAFPDPFERDLVHTQMTRELVDRIPATRITNAQRLRWTDASRLARERARQAPPSRRYAMVEDMTLPRLPAAPPAPAGFQNVPANQVPQTLWYYGNRPYKYSSLVRMGGTAGRPYNPNWAAIETETVATGVHGIRVTTLPPTAPLEAIEAATGLHVSRANTFAVRIHPENLLTTRGIQQVPDAYLRMAERGPAGTYILQTAGRERIVLYEGMHEVITKLP